MNTAQPQPDVLHKESETENAPVKSSEPQPVSTGTTQADLAMQTSGTKPRPLFWETAYYWIMARG